MRPDRSAMRAARCMPAPSSLQALRHLAWRVARVVSAHHILQAARHPSRTGSTADRKGRQSGCHKDPVAARPALPQHSSQAQGTGPGSGCPQAPAGPCAGSLSQSGRSWPGRPLRGPQWHGNVVVQHGTALLSWLVGQHDPGASLDRCPCSPGPCLACAARRARVIGPADCGTSAMPTGRERHGRISNEVPRREQL